MKAVFASGSAKNEFRILEDGTVKMKLTQGKACLVSIGDWMYIRKFCWRANYNKVNRRWDVLSSLPKENGGYTTTYMYRLILHAEDGIDVDHVEPSRTLDMTRANLRLASRTENLWNRRKYRNSASKFKGVSWHNGNNKWQVNICINKRRIHLGYFDNEQDAAKAYDTAAIELFGEFARTNDMLGLYDKATTESAA